MKVPDRMTTAFGKPFEQLVTGYAAREGLLPSPESLESERFLARSIVPHIRKLSSLFNREDGDASEGLRKYWKESSNPANLRLAYFLYFMPSNLYRVASVWAELARLGFRWGAGRELRAIELGAGPASGACGIAAGAAFAEGGEGAGIPRSGSWALIEQDKAMLELGAGWAEDFFRAEGYPDWQIRKFHRTLDLKEGLLPRTAPKFNLWVMSYFLNELDLPPGKIADALLRAWDRHLEKEGVAILVEPALRLQSRRLLELRKAILEHEATKKAGIQLLLPCLGHQACGALADPEDWCHEEVAWWRPSYFRVIDQLAGLDRKTLPFSYLVFAKSDRPREELLPALAGSHPSRNYRLVSPAHAEGREREFFVCGQEGKRRARYRPKDEQDPGADLGRGDILVDAELRGDAHSSRVQSVKKIG